MSEVEKISPKKKVKLSTLPTCQQIYRGLGILIKQDPDLSVDADHDKIMFSSEKIRPKLLDPKDRKRLRVMGFIWDKDDDYWLIFS